MDKKLIAGGCSFTLGNELSDDVDGKTYSKKSWAYRISDSMNMEYVCTAIGGIGNPAIARRVFTALSQHNDVGGVIVMWSFLSRYDWAMPRHHALDLQRWTSISPWDTDEEASNRDRAIADSKWEKYYWEKRNKVLEDTGIKPFANTLYRHAANEYHETYLSWKSIIWLQNILEKRQIPFVFTLADNSLFYREQEAHKDKDHLMKALHDEIDFTKWFSFGERMMGSNQWSLLEDYPRGTTHPLDNAHQDAVKLMVPTYEKIIGGEQ